MAGTPMGAHALVISNTAVRQDAQGRFCLNDLHQAAGSEAKDKPGNWLQTAQAVALGFEVEQTAGIPAVTTIEGRNGGTYVVRELVYAYTMWISAKFHLQVIRAYDDMVTGRLEHLERTQPLYQLADGRQVQIDPIALNKNVSMGLRFKLQEQSDMLMRRLRAEPDAEVAWNLYWQLVQVNSSLGIPVKPLADLRREGGAA